MTLTIKKAHLILSLVLVIATPVATGVGAYYKSIGDIKAEYAKRSEVEKMADKLNRVAEDVSYIRGKLERKP